MKKSTMISTLVLFVTATTLSGCFFPYWDDEGRGHGGGRGGGYSEGGRGGGHEGGHHEGGDRR